mgnify:CR=1 FL=1
MDPLIEPPSSSRFDHTIIVRQIYEDLIRTQAKMPAIVSFVLLHISYNKKKGLAEIYPILLRRGRIVAI